MLDLDLDLDLDEFSTHFLNHLFFSVFIIKSIISKVEIPTCKSSVNSNPTFEKFVIFTRISEKRQ